MDVSYRIETGELVSRDDQASATTTRIYLDLIADEEGFVPFGDVARSLCDEQCQYVSRYIDGRHGAVNLGNRLRFAGDPSDYHFVRIHHEDVAEFVRRYRIWVR